MLWGIDSIDFVRIYNIRNVESAGRAEYVEFESVMFVAV